MVFCCFEVPSGGRSFAVISDADFAPEMDGAMFLGLPVPLCINRELLLTDWLSAASSSDCFLPCKCFASLVMEFLVPGYSCVRNWCFEVAVGAALYIAEAGMVAHVLWNPAAVLLCGHARGGPAFLLMVSSVVSGETA
ncbi:hypothetical protein Nepgr_015850 [Nepenthes gracilis]|uniref:Uncharacterized protein n=1 Tax=Nepenthes gracilis TaxID=150966 RepID=A0AAD3XRH4_NEPGR|nr:hypothetical protein Nepgr_015850 [Nepenthes gracilis]